MALQSNADLKRVADFVRGLIVGKGWQNGGTFTLTASVGSTTITDTRAGPTCTIAYHPTTANAAAEIGNGTMYIAEGSRKGGEFVITHANNAQTDRTFRYAIFG